MHDLLLGGSVFDGLSDHEIVANCIDDPSGQVWEWFVKKYSRLIWHSIHKTFKLYSYKASSEDCEDIYGAIFVSLVEDDFKRLKTFKGEGACSLSTWLSVIAVRKAIDYLRRDNAYKMEDLADIGPEILGQIRDTKYCPAKVFELAQRETLVGEAVERLKPEDKTIASMLLSGMDAVDIAESLGVEAGYVHSRKHRIVEKIRKHVM